MIFAAGVLLILRHLHVWRQVVDSNDDEPELQFYTAQLKRRCLSSCGLSMLGVMFASFAFARTPLQLSILTGGVLLITVMILVLAGLEIFAVRFHLERHRQYAENAKRKLLREHERLKRKIQDNDSEESSGQDYDE